MARKTSTPSAPAPAGYAPALEQLKARIRSAQLQAALSVNQELIRLYWDIGKQIAERQKADKWGSAVIERLARDLQQEFPGVSGFSRQNLWKVRSVEVVERTLPPGATILYGSKSQEETP